MYKKVQYSIFCHALKGQSHEIFDPRFFFSLTCTPGSPDSWAKTILHIESNSRRYSTTKIEIIVGSRNKILSAFTEAVKVTVFQKIGHR
jgi:hypothetical protein